VAAHPGLTIELIETLLADADQAVRHQAALNPAIPAIRLIELLGATDPTVARGAAGNPVLPVTAMHWILDGF
jgi:hypothetical protein